MSVLGRDVGAKVGLGSGMIVLVALLVIFATAMIVTFTYVGLQSGFDRQYRELAGDMVVAARQLDRDAASAAQGLDGAFQQLSASQQRFVDGLEDLRSGDDGKGLPPVPEALSQPVERLSTRWSEYAGEIDLILESQQTVALKFEAISGLREQLPRLFELSNSVAEQLSQARGASTGQVFVAGQQLALVERMRRQLQRLEGTQGNTVEAVDALATDLARFDRDLQGQLDGAPNRGIARVNTDEIRDQLEASSVLLDQVRPQVERLLDVAPNLAAFRDAVANVTERNPELVQGLQAFEAAIEERSTRLGLITALGYLLGGVALLILALLGFLLVKDYRRRLALTTEQNRRNQRAILQLLDEMSNLADGDLTVHATVTEDITGAIADSVNYAIDALRDLVTTINSTAVEVAAAAEATQATAMRLAEASNQQASQIASASGAITQMAHSIEQVSDNAANSSRVAQNAVDIASKGADTVQRTIRGMDTIREQIQETSKRIKRLGESSQEIGDIVGLIDEISDQTNILALNAAIQASMAGEAGRGFAVVADEVQRLAERSSDATKQIEALVKTIQADTNEAVISMEQTTSNVVSGAELSQDAGKALEEIQNVSNRLAQLIESISQASNQQAAVAANISGTMQKIQEITQQTLGSTNETATQIGNLTTLSSDLRKSVAGFKLPEGISASSVI